MSLLKISSPAFQKAHDGSKIAREMSSAVSPSKGSSSASWMFTRTQLETEKKTLSLCREIETRSVLGGDDRGARAGLRLYRQTALRGVDGATKPQARGHSYLGAYEAWPASERHGRARARCGAAARYRAATLSARCRACRQ